jgi:hypothetical protein
MAFLNLFFTSRIVVLGAARWVAVMVRRPVSGSSWLSMQAVKEKAITPPMRREYSLFMSGRD